MPGDGWQLKEVGKTTTKRFEDGCLLDIGIKLAQGGVILEQVRCLLHTTCIHLQNSELLAHVMKEDRVIQLREQTQTTYTKIAPRWSQWQDLMCWCLEPILDSLAQWKWFFFSWFSGHTSARHKIVAYACIYFWTAALSGVNGEHENVQIYWDQDGSMCRARSLKTKQKRQI